MMESFQNFRPRLIEPGVKYFLNSSLEQCKQIKAKYNNFFYNLGMFLLFVIIIGTFLYMKYRNKNNKKMQEEQRHIQQQYIMNKLRFMQDYNKQQSKNIFTDLPVHQQNIEQHYFNRQNHDRKIFS